mgnify:CR=1 FL=1
MKFPLPIVGRTLLLSVILAAIACRGRAQERAAESFDGIVAAIVANNPELKFYEAEIDAAKAGRRSAGVLASPELSVEAGQIGRAHV